MKKYWTSRWISFQRWNLNRQLAAARVKHAESVCEVKHAEARAAKRATECSDITWELNHLATGRKLLSTSVPLRPRHAKA